MSPPALKQEHNKKKKKKKKKKEPHHRPDPDPPSRPGHRGLTSDLTPQGPPPGFPLDAWHKIADHLSWWQVLKLANSCVDFVPLRHALDAELQHLQEPEHIACGLLRYRIQQGSKHIPRLIMNYGKKNNEALRKEVTARLDTFRQWWVYEPFENKRSERQHRQTEETRHA
jgi:hypothetical protein